MKLFNLKQMTKGWFVGAFEPTAYNTEAAEVAIKTYSAGDSESLHYHKLATELTVIISGEVIMNQHQYSAGDILLIPPGESTDFHAVTPVTTVVVKLPGARNDKYPGASA